MPRPPAQRRCRHHHGDRVFKPRSIPMHALHTVQMTLSELEAMRLCDLEQHDQESAGRQMGVSRGTVQRLLKSGRTKTIAALVHTHALAIQRGEDHEALYSDD